MYCSVPHQADFKTGEQERLTHEFGCKLTSCEILNETTFQNTSFKFTSFRRAAERFSVRFAKWIYSASSTDSTVLPKTDPLTKGKAEACYSYFATFLVILERTVGGGFRKHKGGQGNNARSVSTRETHEDSKHESRFLSELEEGH